MSDYGRFKLPTDAAALRISYQSQEQYENVRLAASDSNGEMVERRISERRASLATPGAAPELTDARTLRAALVAVTDALDAIGDIPNSKIATAWCAQNSEAKIKHARAILATTKKAGQ